MKFPIPLFLAASLFIGCSTNNTGSSSSGTSDTLNTEKAPTKPVTKNWLGKWERQVWQNEAVLEIISIKGDSLEFALYASNGGNTGELGGNAFVDGNIAIFLNEDDLDTCLIQFELLGDSVITIDQKQGDCYAGMGVRYDGIFRNSKKIKTETTETLLSLEIFKTEKQDSIFRTLVDSSYSLFVNSTQITTEDEDLDGLRTTVQSSGVRGLFTFMENIIMVDSMNNIWAAVIDDNKIHYFTNMKEYKNRLPKTIDNWRQRFRDYPIIYR